MAIDFYVIVGASVGVDWDVKPDDGDDDWYDRHKELVIYEPNVGDIVVFSDIDHSHYQYIGRVVYFDKGKWSQGLDVDEAYDVNRLAKEIEEVSAILKDRFDIDIPCKLYVVANYC